MAHKPVGGRGKKAPYETVIVRVPEPMAERVKHEANVYRDLALNGCMQPENLEELNWKDFDPCYVPKVSAIDKAEQILKHKKSARISLEKLLQVLYNDNTIKLNDLRK